MVGITSHRRRQKCYLKIVTRGEIPNNNFTRTKIKIDPGRRGIKWFDTDYPEQCKYDVGYQKIDKNEFFIDRHFALQICELYIQD